MNLFLSLVVLGIGLWIWPGNISEVPFSELTLRMVGLYLMSWLLFIDALYHLWKSFEQDRIWPWRWTWPYFGNLLIRVALITFIALFGYWLMSQKDLQGLSAVFWALVLFGGVCYAMFSPEVEYFREKERDRSEA